MAESFQYGDKGQKAEEAVSQMEEAIGELEEAIGYVESAAE
jgi:exonuclease VII small subunit